MPAVVLPNNTARRMQLKPAGPGPEMAEYLNSGISVKAIIDEIDQFDWDVSDLQWIIDNKKGNLQKWAKKEIKTAKEDPPE